ncbi:hypothetical protein [Actinocorallia populi]|nr:hypothetical protein [Actinocorallia populi]
MTVPFAWRVYRRRRAARRVEGRAARQVERPSAATRVAAVGR